MNDALLGANNTDTHVVNPSGLRGAHRVSSSSSAGPAAHSHATSASQAAGRHSPAYVWYVVGLLALVNVFNLMDRMALALLAPHVKLDLKLTDGGLGLLTGFAFAVFYAICGIPIARWADSGIRRNIIALALSVWSIMTALSGAAQNFWHLFFARVGVGAGEAGGLAPAQSMLCDYVPLKSRPGAFAVHSFGLTAGMMVGMAVAGLLVDLVGWRWTFVLLGMPGLLLAAIVRLTLREPQRGAFDAVKDVGAAPSLRETAATLWKCRTYRRLTFMFIAGGFASHGLFQWWPSYYTREFGLGLSTVGVSLGVAIGVGSGVGMLLGGILGNKATQRDVRLPLTVGGTAVLAAVPVAVASIMTQSVSLSLFLVSLTVVLLNVPSAPVVASLYSVMTSRMRATGGVLVIFFQSVLGFGLGPFCVGLLSDFLAPSLGVTSLRFALLLPILLFPVMAAFLYAASRTMRSDLKAAGAAGGFEPIA